ncbi:MAG: hypothetical protein LBJ22_06625 [Synergistaceae bacterium]|jgi:hypothetical protein|nr:hypothetical protein [Synergistaceae bacterium]
MGNDKGNIIDMKEVKDMKELTREEMLEILCAPEAVDEPEESDFIAESELEERAEELFIKNWITKELN